eukprot:SAG11_NODE_832_length_6948_cov_10.083662_8_plen_95_part_00
MPLHLQIIVGAYDEVTDSSQAERRVRVIVYISARAENEHKIINKLEELATMEVELEVEHKEAKFSAYIEQEKRVGLEGRAFKTEVLPHRGNAYL